MVEWKLSSSLNARSSLNNIANRRTTDPIIAEMSIEILKIAFFTLKVKLGCERKFKMNGLIPKSRNPIILGIDKSKITKAE
jgi:hypothetical protein